MKGASGLVVIGWLGRGSTTLHCTYHACHIISDTRASFLLWSAFVRVMRCCVVAGHAGSVGVAQGSHAVQCHAISPQLELGCWVRRSSQRERWLRLYGPVKNAISQYPLGGGNSAGVFNEAALTAIASSVADIT